jgi:hypothetical protein
VSITLSDEGYFVVGRLTLDTQLRALFLHNPLLVLEELGVALSSEESSIVRRLIESVQTTHEPNRRRQLVHAVRCADRLPNA